jgi:hypothetical protein
MRANSSYKLKKPKLGVDRFSFLMGFELRASHLLGRSSTT